MSETSASRAEAPVRFPASPKVLVWDAPVRVFHWLIVATFAGAYLTAESEHWRLLHVTLGYTMAGLVVFRILWGLVGTRYARFSDFLRGPATVAQYVRATLRGQPQHFTGHNPAGAVSIVALLVLALVISASGWAIFNDKGGDWLSQLHAGATSVMLIVVAVHVAGVLLASWMHHENLVGSMVTGRKPGNPQDSVRSAWRSVAVLMLLAVSAFWSWQWHNAPSQGLDGAATTSQGTDHDNDND